MKSARRCLNYLSLCTAAQIGHPPEHPEILYRRLYGVGRYGTKEDERASPTRHGGDTLGML